ncbi:vWA domain-containing protein [Nocardia fluminea]|uniref:vWA domain-containing protein n=1 Tax=Nocardia fluminea TaxID=134984 RepID=UPI003D1169C4
MPRVPLTAALTAVALTVLPASFPAVAQADPGLYAPTMLILDASGSMERPDQGGTMMDSAKRAVRAFVASAPAESSVGLTTYGTGTSNSEADKAAGCRDVQVLRQPTTIDKPALITAVDGIHARGWTPMGTALRQAADALPDSGSRSIVLVSDGDDTCSPPDPCEVAKELKQQGLDLIVHSIGFAVDDKARAQLTCAAQATGGTYSDAADGAALERLLPRVSSAALRNYQATGTPITGTDEYRTAPVAKPGQYLDTIGQQQKRLCAVDVPAGATAYFTGIVSFPRAKGVSMTEDMNALELRVFGRDGVDCNIRERELETRASDGVALTVAKTFEGATEEPTSGDSAQCKGGRRYYFELNWDLVAKGSPARYVFYRVRLDWGQGLAYRVRFAETGGANSTAASNVETTLYSPLGREIDSDTTVYTGRSSAELVLASVPVRYANRDLSDAQVQRQAVAGWHYIAVKLGIPMGADALPPTPIQLDVTVSGAAEPGPSYVGTSAQLEADQPVAVGGPATVARPWALYVLIGAGVALVVGIGTAIVVVGRRRD